MKITHGLVSLALFVSSTPSGHAITVDLTSGTTGDVSFNQSFNETRGVTATVLGTGDLNLFSMRLDEFNIGLSPGGSVGARVYANDTGALIAAANTAVPVGFDQSVTIPIFTTLAAGGTYRFAFFVGNGLNGGSGDIFDPDPQNAFGFSYVESGGLFHLTNAWAIPADAFPTNPNTSIPLMFLEVRPVPEPTAFWLLASGLLPLVVIVARWRTVPRDVLLRAGQATR
jgi:hypothetical protein